MILPSPHYEPLVHTVKHAEIGQLSDKKVGRSDRISAGEFRSIGSCPIHSTTGPQMLASEVVYILRILRTIISRATMTERQFVIVRVFWARYLVVLFRDQSYCNVSRILSTTILLRTRNSQTLAVPTNLKFIV